MIIVTNGLQATCVHCRRWGIDAGQARNVKPHIDLLLKLHKMLNKDRQPELKMNSEKMLKKYGSSPTCGNAMLGVRLILIILY